MTPGGPKMPQDHPKMTPRCPKTTPRWPQDHPIPGKLQGNIKKTQVNLTETRAVRFITYRVLSRLGPRTLQVYMGYGLEA